MGSEVRAGRPRVLHRGAIAALCTIAAFTGGCATITTGSSQTLSIDTDPPGAACTLTRAEEVIGVVNPTPGSISVSKSKKDISIACKKEGYLAEQGTITSSTQAATFGNILLGGLIGFGVDAMSGSMSKYSTFLSLQMIPESFASTDERDAYFDKLREHLHERSSSRKEQINKNCTSEKCTSSLKGVDEEETAALARLDTERTRATIRAAQ